MIENNIIDLEASKSTPRVLLDGENKEFLIEGHSYPENASSFFTPIVEWIKEYLVQDEVVFILNIRLLYINTSSTKAMFYIFDILEDAYAQGKDIKVNWLYHKDNEMSKETGEELLEDFDLPYELVEIND